MLIRTTREERLMSREDPREKRSQAGLILLFSQQEVVEPRHAEDRAWPRRTTLALNVEQHSFSSRGSFENRIVLVPLRCALQ